MSHERSTAWGAGGRHPASGVKGPAPVCKPTGCAITALAGHPLLSHQGLWDGGRLVQKASVEPRVSTGRWGTPAPAYHNPAPGAQSPSITGYILSFHPQQKTERVSSSHLKGQGIG